MTNGLRRRSRRSTRRGSDRPMLAAISHCAGP
jgi:hypothetical protein